MLILSTTSAELYVHVDAPPETWLLYEARFVPDTPYRLAGGEYLRDLRCSLRVFPWSGPVRSKIYNDIGWLCFADRYDDAMRKLPTECLIDLAVGQACTGELVAAARIGRIPTRVEFTLLSKDDLPGERTLRHIDRADGLLIKAASFRIPLVPECAGSNVVPVR